MGRRLQRWRALDGRDRWRLIGCVVGLLFVHASLAVFGYGRTRRMIERVSRRTPARAATPAEIADAQALARLAASAGANALGEATCLRRALLLHGWLRRRGLRPVHCARMPGWSWKGCRCWNRMPVIGRSDRPHPRRRREPALRRRCQSSAG